jgi:outer membrane lipoprotein LolB
VAARRARRRAAHLARVAEDRAGQRDAEVDVEAVRGAALNSPCRLPFAALHGLRRLAAGLVVATLAAGCASLPPPPPAERAYSGRFAAISRIDERSENVSGRFNLLLSGDALTLDLATPLGNTLARIEASSDGARLRAPADDGSLREVYGPSGEALTERVLGYALPVAGIGDWIEGRPAAGAPVDALVTGAGGKIESFEQYGWSIAIDERFADAGTPRRLTCSRPAGRAEGLAPAAPAVTLRLVLDEPAAQ